MALLEQPKSQKKNNTRRASLVATIFALSSIGAPALFSQQSDIDIERAQSAYNSRLSVTQDRLRDYSREDSILDSYQSDLDLAESEVQTAQRSVNDAETRIQRARSDQRSAQSQIERIRDQQSDLRQEIRDLQNSEGRWDSEISSLQSEKRSVERDIEELRRDIRRLENQGGGHQDRDKRWVCTAKNLRGQTFTGEGATRREASDDAKDQCESESRACTIEDCEQVSGHIGDGDNDNEEELRRLRDRLRDCEQQLDQIERDLQRLISQRDRVDDDIRSKQREIDSLERDISSAESDYEDAINEESRAESQLTAANRDLRSAQSDEAQAEANVRVQQSAVFEAERRYQAAKAESDRALAYLEQVKRNFAAELAQGSKLGQDRAVVDGNREASDRIASLGTDAGRRDGDAAGSTKGIADSKRRSFASGHQYGRTQGHTDTSLATSFRAGYQQGEEIAVRKAQLESKPKGFNDEYATIVNSTPSSQQVVNVSSEIPQDSGGNGIDLRDSRMDVSTVSEPFFAAPEVVTEAPPSVGTPRVAVPAVDNRYYNEPCNSLRHPDFTKACIQSYRSQYPKSFNTNFETLFLAQYAPSFAAAAKASYAVAFRQEDTGETRLGKEKGANENGVLRGFAEKLSSAHQEQYLAGRNAMRNRLAEGHLLALRSTVLEDANGDGFLTPGEQVFVTATIDNLGKVDSGLNVARISITSKALTIPVTAELRALPALRGETRTVLRGAFVGKSNAAFSGDLIALEGTIDIQDRLGAYKPAMSFKASKSTQFPIELVAVDSDVSALPLTQWTDITATFKNQTSKATEPLNFKVSTKPLNIEVNPKEPVTLPALAPGETGTVTLSVKPTVWAGGTPAVFAAENVNADGQKIFEQWFAKEFKYARTAELALLTTANQPQGARPLVVKAGDLAQFKVKLNYQVADRRGPMVLRFVNASDPDIKPENSTVSVNYGQIGPTTQIPPAEFKFRIPAKLKGKRSYIAIGLEESGVGIHYLQVWVDPI